MTGAGADLGIASTPALVGDPARRPQSDDGFRIHSPKLPRLPSSLRVESVSR